MFLLFNLHVYHGPCIFRSALLIYIIVTLTSDSRHLPKNWMNPFIKVADEFLFRFKSSTEVTNDLGLISMNFKTWGKWKISFILVVKISSGRRQIMVHICDHTDLYSFWNTTKIFKSVLHAFQYTGTLQIFKPISNIRNILLRFTLCNRCSGTPTLANTGYSKEHGHW